MVCPMRFVLVFLSMAVAAAGVWQLKEIEWRKVSLPLVVRARGRGAARPRSR